MSRRGLPRKSHLKSPYDRPVVGQKKATTMIRKELVLSPTPKMTDIWDFEEPEETEETEEPMLSPMLTTTEIWEELGVFQKAVTSTTSPAVFTGGPEYTYLEKVYNLIEWALPENKPTQTSCWNVVRYWAKPETMEKATAFRETLMDLLRVWKKVGHHPNVSPCLGLALKSTPSHDPRHCNTGLRLNDADLIPGIVMPFHESAMDYLERQSPTASVIPLLIDVAEGLAYLHGFTPPIVHGKIKGANILISQGPLKALLTDIGLINLPFTLEREEGRWLAPELLRTLAPELFRVLPADNMERSSAYSITPASDVYSFAMMVVEMITRKKPFAYVEDMSIDEIIGFRAITGFGRIGMAKLRRPDVPAMMDDLWELLEKCLAYDPSKRPEMEYVLNSLDVIYSTGGPFEELTEESGEDIEGECSKFEFGDESMWENP